MINSNYLKKLRMIECSGGKRVNRVVIEKLVSLSLHKSASIRPRTDLPKFGQTRSPSLGSTKYPCRRICCQPAIQTLRVSHRRRELARQASRGRGSPRGKARTPEPSEWRGFKVSREGNSVQADFKET